MGFFYFLLFIFLTRTVAGQWRHNLAVPPTHTQAPPLACPHTPSRRASPCRRRNRDRTDPVACTSATCSRRRPDAATTATTRTAAPPTAAAGPTPTQKPLDKFFFLFLFFSSHLDLAGQWRSYHRSHPHLPCPHSGHPCSPATTSPPKPQPAAAAMTLSPPQPWPLQPPPPQLSPPQPPPPPQSLPPPQLWPSNHRHLTF